MKLIQSGHKIDFTHTINHLSFGTKTDQKVINSKYGGTINNELNGKKIDQNIPFGSLLVNYYLDITEEEYTDTTYTIDSENSETGQEYP